MDPQMIAAIMQQMRARQAGGGAMPQPQGGMPPGVPPQGMAGPQPGMAPPSGMAPGGMPPRPPMGGQAPNPQIAAIIQAIMRKQQGVPA